MMQRSGAVTHASPTREVTLARSPRRQKVAILLILLVALALRLYQLGQRTVWYDEAFSIFLSQANLGAIASGTAADFHPPLYYWMLHFWQSLGTQPFVTRFLSVALSLLCTALAYPVARRMLSPRAALWGMLFVAIAPFQIAYAQELRMYSLLELGALIYLLGFVLIQEQVRAPISDGGRIEQPGWRRMALPFAVLVLGGTVALYSQGLAVVTWLAPDFVVLWRRDWKTARYLFVGQLLTLVLFAPWLVILVGQFTRVQHSFYASRPGLVEVVQLLLAFTTNQPLPNALLPLALFVSLAATAFLALALVRRLSRRDEPGLVTLVTFLIIPPLLMFGLSSVARSVFVLRAVIFSSVAYALLCGWLIAQVRGTRWQLALAVIGGAAVLVALPFQYGYSEFPRSPFESANVYLRANAQAGDLLVHDNKLSYFPMHYYDLSLSQVWLPDPPNSESDTLAPASMEAMQAAPTPLTELDPGAARIWFVIFQRAIDEAASAGTSQANLAWLDQHYRRIRVERLNDLDIFLYER